MKGLEALEMLYATSEKIEFNINNYKIAKKEFKKTLNKLDKIGKIFDKMGKMDIGKGYMLEEAIGYIDIKQILKED